MNRDTRSGKWTRVATLGTLVAGLCGAQPSHADGRDRGHAATITPIHHVILIIGENRSFDQLFGTFAPNPGQSVWNLLSEGIVNANGTPGPHFIQAAQWQATDTSGYSIHPPKTAPYAVLPRINVDGTPAQAPFSSVAAAQAVEPALPNNAYWMLTVGGSGLPAGTLVDPRFPASLAGGPYDITRYLTYHDYAASPVHRFFQMWQQTDCNMTNASARNPSGCADDLFPWVEATVGAGSNGAPQPADYGVDGHHEGAISMGFYNVQAGDVHYFDRLAHEYALSDNDHQAIMGGTGANHIALGYGTAIFYAGPSGQPAQPPANQVENPDAMPGTDNFYAEDGYSGGSYVDCSDETAPGVGSIDRYLATLPYPAFRQGDCRHGAYYLVNNYNPGFLGNGTAAPLGAGDFTVPPTRQDNLALLLARHGISWGYYGEGWQGGTEGGENGTYCNICNPFLYSQQVMTNPGLRAHLHGIRALYAAVRSGNLPAVSIVKPDGYLDGHPASSKFELFEAFSRKIIRMVRARPGLWRHTAILITVDESGGYYDSGYIQPIDFFGDGPRIPLIAVSPYSRGVGMVHTYSDHVSFDKFIEANWQLPPISARSRDNLPDPVTAQDNPYVPVNGPAIGDLMTMFRFDRR